MSETVELGPVLPVVERAPVPRSAKALAGLVPLTLAASVVTAVVGVSSSSGGHPVSSARLTSLRAAGARVAQVGSFRDTINETLSTGGVTLRISGQQTYDVIHHRSETRLTTAGNGLTRTMDEIVDGGEIYVSNGNGHWGEAALPSSLTSLRDDSNLDTITALDKVTDRGEATVDGVDTEHYRGVISAILLAKLQKVVGSIAPGNAPQVGLALKSLANAPVDLYIDHQDLPRRMMLSLDVSVLGHRLHGSATSDFSDFGQAMSITVPADAATYPSVQDLLGIGG